MAAISELRRLKGAPAPKQRSVPLVGRASLLEKLCQNARPAGILFGEPGVGKSRLLWEASARLGAAGADVYRISCLPSGQDLPMECLIELAKLLSRRGRIGRSMLRAIIEAGERDRPAFIRDALESALHDGPIAVQLDDLHWADPTSLEALHYCIDRLQDLPIHWQAASRFGGAKVEHIALALERAHLASRFEVDGLSPEQLHEFAHHVAPEARLDAAAASRLHALTAGNPFYAELVLQSRTYETGEVAPDLRRALAERFSSMSVAAMDAAGWLAVNVDPLPVEALARLLGSSPGQTKTLLAEMIDARIVRRAPGGVSFRHSLLRDARYEMMNDQERIDRHLALAARSEDDRVRVGHLEGAERFEEAAGLNLRIGWQSLDRDAPREALHAFVRARETTPSDAVKWEGQGGAAIALYALGKREEAALAMAAFDDAAANGSPRVSAHVHGLYAETIWYDALDYTTAIAHLETSIAEARQGDPELLPRLLCALGAACERSGDLKRAKAVLAEGLAACAPGSAAREAIRLESWLGVVVGRLGDPVEGIRILEKVTERAAALRLDNEVAHACTRLCFLCDLAGDQARYEHWCRRGLEIDVHGARAVTALLQSNLASVASDGGRLREALGLSIGSSKMLDSGNIVYLCRALCAQAFLNAFLGDFESADANLREASSLDPPPAWRRAIAYSAGSVNEIREDVESALASYEEALDGRRGEDLEAYEIRALAGLVRTRCKLGLRDGAAEALEWLRAIKKRGRSIADSLLSEAEAWWKRFDGDVGGGCAALLAAADRPQHPYWRAQLRLDVGHAMCSRDLILDAIAAFEGMEAHAAADRGRAIARSLGLRPGRRSQPKRFLTPREAIVAQLVARGKTNGEIAKDLHVSRRTVEMHVSTILAKAGLKSRVEVATRIAAGEFPEAP
jgi:DNA-binding CsgD family transcriptional regulator/tetratricopeptide (TPR) repeat protein